MHETVSDELCLQAHKRNHRKFNHCFFIGIVEYMVKHKMRDHYTQCTIYDLIVPYPEYLKFDYSNCSNK